MTDEYISSQVAELKTDPDVSTVYGATAISYFDLHKVFDHQSSNLQTLSIEPGDDVFVSVNHDGTWYINFLSIYPNTYHFRCLGIGSMADNEHVHIELPLKEL